jgi:hypothetical protein
MAASKKPYVKGIHDPRKFLRLPSLRFINKPKLAIQKLPMNSCVRQNARHPALW